jgi:hypothetical protein
VLARADETAAKVPFQEFRHSGGMTESSPAIHRRVCRQERPRPGGTLDRPLANEFHSSLRDGQLSFGDDPAMNRRATFRCPSGTSILSPSDFLGGL